MTGGDNGRGRATAGNEPPRSGGYYHLMKAVIHRDLVIWLRYPVNAATGILMALIFFGLIFYGGRLVAGQAIDDTIEGLIVGYFLWTLAQGAYFGITNDVQAEAGWGTLERHFMTPFGFGPVILAKSIAVVLRTFLTSAVVLAAMLVMTGRSLELPLVTVVVVAALAVASAFGLGLAMGGLSVLYKRINNVANLLQFAFIGLISAPVFEIPWTRILPLVQGSALLQVVMRDGDRLWELDPLALAILVGTAGFYLGAGYLAFVLATRRARRLGVLGDY